MFSARRALCLCLFAACFASACDGTASAFIDPLDDPGINDPVSGYCVWRADGEHCDGQTLRTCQNGKQVAREVCALGCLPGPHAGCIPSSYCEDLKDGTYCDAGELVTCDGAEETARELCAQGCVLGENEGTDGCAQTPVSSNYCTDKLDGFYCDGQALVNCRNRDVASRTACQTGCESMPNGTPDRCRPPASSGTFCTNVPSKASSAPPTLACSYMDWTLQDDGFYAVSRFGGTGAGGDGTTAGRTTTCGYLQGHYNGRNCIFDRHRNACIPGSHDIPWVTGTVDHNVAAMNALVDQHAGGNVPKPEYFYVAGAQRFGCGAVLRVSNPVNGRCIVAYAEDGGPGTTFEYANRASRRILDSSPAIHRYLDAGCCWSSSQMFYVEWGLPGDVPGQACTPCQSTPAKAGTESMRALHDPNHMMPRSCR